MFADHNFERIRTASGCMFELVTLSIDPGCGVQCALSPARSEDFDRTLEEMAQRLRQAFGPSPG